MRNTSIIIAMIIGSLKKKAILGPKWVAVATYWRKLHNEQLCGLYLSPNIIRVIKSKAVRWVVLVATRG
jgi:hypothetical protein